MASNNNKPLILLALIIVFFLTIVSSSSSIGSLDVDFDIGSWMDVSELEETIAMSSSNTHCQGTIGECSIQEGDDDEDEFDMESESHRRILAGRRRYISYGALNRNRVPCSRRGASYYNCRPGASANPYRRGCSRISRCRRR